ncbi:MAG: SgcJ/EcaC family oxidoreductase [Acidobacteriaceae bacterium]|nr:SgcJ/EcaC family oxidoreductase [Acidobacteriaceae bacterium]
MNIRAVVVCIAGLLGFGVNAMSAMKNPDIHAADIQAIKDNEAQWNKDFQAKDVEKLVAHYADDAVLISPGEPVATGKDAIRAALKQMVSDTAMSIHFSADRVEVANSGDMAYSQGSYTINMTNPGTKEPMSDKGSYVTVYQKQGGSWKAVSDIASSATPPGTAMTK